MQEVIGSGRRRAELLCDQSGLSTVEYVIILVLIAAIAIGSWVTFGGQVRCALGLTNDELVTAFGDGTSTATQACAKTEGGSGSEGKPSAGGGDSPKVKTKTPATVGPPGASGR